MSHTRRDFITGLTALGAAGLTGTSTRALGREPSRPGAPPRRRSPGARLRLTYRPYTLELKHVFTLPTSSRTTTPVVLTEIEWEGVVGYGEASVPPYLGESHDTATAFLAKLDLAVDGGRA